MSPAKSVTETHDLKEQQYALENLAEEIHFLISHDRVEVEEGKGLVLCFAEAWVLMKDLSEHEVDCTCGPGQTLEDMIIAIKKNVHTVAARTRGRVAF